MGRPKAWLPFGPGEVLLQRVVRLVGQAVGPVVVVAAPGQDLPTLPDHVSIARDERADRGPLQGLAAGLDALAGRADLAYASAVDSPFFVAGWVELLRDRIGDRDLAIPRVGGFLQPLNALYRRESCLPVIQDLLNNDRLKAAELAERAAALVLDEDAMKAADPGLRTLWNVNTPEDYARALIEMEV